MRKIIKCLSIVLTMMIIFQTTVPGVSAVVINNGIVVGIHKNAEKGKDLFSSDESLNLQIENDETKNISKNKIPRIIGEDINLRNEYS